MFAKKRKYTCTSCRSCFNNRSHLKDHILGSIQCQQKYFVCDCCKDYVGDQKQGLLQHFNSTKGLARGCEDHYNMRNNVDVALLPMPPCHSSDHSNKRRLRLSEDVDLNFNMAESPQLESFSHVFQPGNNSGQIQLVQFESNIQKNNGLNDKSGRETNNIFNYSKDCTTSNAKNISGNGKFGNVTSTLPGVVNDRYIVHKPEYKQYHTRDDCISLSSSDSDNTDVEYSKETNTEYEEENDLSDFASHASETSIRVVRLPAQISEATHDVPSTYIDGKNSHGEESNNETIDDNSPFPVKKVNIDNVEFFAEDATKT